MRFPNIRQNTRIGPLMVFLLRSSGRGKIGSFKRVGSSGDKILHLNPHALFHVTSGPSGQY
jgi:hypothetical protein